MCAIDDGERAEVYLPSQIKARKSHMCDECGRIIAIGEVYGSAKMLTEGFWAVFQTCAHCLVANAWLMKNCGGVMHAGVGEDISEHIGEYAHIPALAFGLSRLKFGMRRHWKSFKSDGLLPIPSLPRAIKAGDFA